METKAPFADCEHCPLQRQPFVAGYGPAKAELVIVGEAPGRNEVKTGVPFIGKAGQLLDKVLRAHGIDRSKSYVTNTVLCWPGPKADNKGNATPTAKAIKACRPRLINELAEHEPKNILTLGAIASKTTLGTKDSMTAMRIGGVKHNDELPEVNIVPTFHPAAAFYNPDLFPNIVSDIKKLARGTLVEVGWEPTQYEVADYIGSGLRNLGMQLGYPQLSIDLETGKPYDRHEPRILCVGISHKPGHAIVYDGVVANNPEWLQLLNAGFAGKPKWIMQNGKEVDVQWLWGAGVTNAHVDFDTLLAHYLTDERKGIHGLEQLATEILGAPLYKHEAKSEIEGEVQDLEYLPRDTLHQYNATDADVTHRLVAPLIESMRSDGVVWPFKNLLIPGANALAAMEFEGVTVDLDYVDKMENELTEKLEGFEQELEKWVANPRSHPQVKATLHELGFNVPNTAEGTIKGLDHEFVEKLLEHRGAQKLLSTYVRGIRKHIQHGRVHSDFLLHGTETGRTSSRRPNLQNQPPIVRPIFTASSPDNVLVNFDYKAIELRVAAFLTRDPFLLKVMRDPTRNIHQEKAVSWYGENYDHHQYVRTKGVNFGVIYDRQAPAIAKEWAANMGIPYPRALKAATVAVQEWKRDAPGIWEFHKLIRTAINSQGYLRSAFGRVRRFWFVTDDNRQDVYREGYNFPIQSVGGDLNLLALINLTSGLKANGFSAKPIITVHDSNILDIPKSELDETIEYVVSVMEDTPLDVPMPVEYKVDYRWMEEK